MIACISSTLLRQGELNIAMGIFFRFFAQCHENNFQSSLDPHIGSGSA